MPGGLLCNASKLLPDVGAAVDVAVADAISKVYCCLQPGHGAPDPKLAHIVACFKWTQCVACTFL